MGHYSDEQQQLIIATYKLIIDDAKSLEELLRQPITWKVACMSPDEMTDERKEDLQAYYDAKFQALRDAGKRDRFFARIDEASEKIGIF